MSCNTWSDNDSMDAVTMETSAQDYTPMTLLHESREIPDSTQLCSLESKITKRCRLQKDKTDSRKHQDGDGNCVDWITVSRYPQAVNCSRCRYMCTKNITETQRITVCRIFHGLNDATLQRNFIRNHILESKPKTITTDAKEHRAVSRFYYLPVQDNKIRVCCKFFSKTLNVTSWAIEKWMKTEFQPVNTAPPLESLSDLIECKKTIICQHISLFPTMESRTKTNLRFLEANLDLDVMYEHFKKFWRKLLLRKKFDSLLNADQQGLSAIDEMPSMASYSSVFNSCFNFSFSGVPYNRCDDCCVKLPQDIADSSEHCRRHSLAELERSKDKYRMMNSRDGRFLTATVDLRNYLPIPCVDSSSFIYKRKLSLHNITVHDGLNNGTCFVWLETEGQYGVNELGSVLYRYLSRVAASTVRDVTLFIETQVQSFQKQRLASLLLQAVRSLPLSSVELKFIVSDHNRVANDSLQVAVRHAIVHLTAYVPHDWINVIRGACHKYPYAVNNLNVHDFFDLRVLTDELFPHRRNNVLGVPVNWSDVVCLRTEKEQPMRISYRTESGLENFVMAERKLVELKRAYETLLPISQLKKTDLIALCTDDSIPKMYHSFYRSIPSDDVTTDLVPDFTNEIEETGVTDSDVIEHRSQRPTSSTDDDVYDTCRQTTIKRGRWQDLVNASEQYYYQQQNQGDFTAHAPMSAEPISVRRLISAVASEEY